jgi:hypothetical protein
MKGASVGEKMTGIDDAGGGTRVRRFPTTLATPRLQVDRRRPGLSLAAESPFRTNRPRPDDTRPRPFSPSPSVARPLWVRASARPASRPKPTRFPVGKQTPAVASRFISRTYGQHAGETGPN